MGIKVQSKTQCQQRSRVENSRCGPMCHAGWKDHVVVLCGPRGGEITLHVVLCSPAGLRDHVVVLCSLRVGEITLWCYVPRGKEKSRCGPMWGGEMRL